MISKVNPWAIPIVFVVFIVQSFCGVVAEAQDPTRWKDVMREFSAEDEAFLPANNAIVFTGSSSFARWKSIQQDLLPIRAINRGFGGSTLVDVIYWREILILKHRPKAIVIYAGDNDIAIYHNKPEMVLDGFKELVSRVHTDLPTVQVYFVSIKPSIRRWNVWPESSRANTLIRAFCEEHPRLHFIDVASVMLDEKGQPRADLFETDNLHLNAKGYAVWSTLIRSVLLDHQRLPKLDAKAGTGDGWGQPR